LFDTLESGAVLLLPQNVGADPFEACNVFLDSVLSEGKEREENHGGNGDGPPEEVSPPEDRKGDEESGEEGNTREVGVDVCPAGPWAEPTAACEPHVDSDYKRSPEHLDNRHRHEAKVSASSEGGTTTLKVAGECNASLKEMVESEA